MKPKQPTTAARALFDKLAALAERGVNGEKIAAQTKLDRLKARYDFTQPVKGTVDLFAGKFQRASVAVPVFTFGDDFDVAPSVKWAIEHATGIACAFRERELLAEATPRTAKKLAGIAATIAESFVSLWQQYHQAGANPADRNTFHLGLYDGMMNEPRPELLPTRAEKIKHSARCQKRAVVLAPGLTLHPYSVAVTLGQRIRFNVPLNLIAEELGNTIKGAIAE
jgi:hypothetical protein